MRRVPLTFILALKVLESADPRQLEEWRSLISYEGTTPIAREMVEYSPLKWAIMLGDWPVAAFGCFRTTNTVLTGWCMTVENAPKKTWAFMLRQMKIAAESIFKLGVAERIHAFCCTNRPEPVYYASKGGMSPLVELKNYGSKKDFKLMAITPRDLS